MGLDAGQLLDLHAKAAHLASRADLMADVEERYGFKEGTLLDQHLGYRTPSPPPPPRGPRERPTLSVVRDETAEGQPRVIADHAIATFEMLVTGGPPLPIQSDQPQP